MFRRLLGGLEPVAAAGAGGLFVPTREWDVRSSRSAWVAFLFKGGEAIGR